MNTLIKMVRSVTNTGTSTLDQHRLQSSGLSSSIPKGPSRLKPHNDGSESSSSESDTDTDTSDSDPGRLKNTVVDLNALSQKSSATKSKVTNSAGPKSSTSVPDPAALATRPFVPDLLKPASVKKTVSTEKAKASAAQPNESTSESEISSESESDADTGAPAKSKPKLIAAPPQKAAQPAPVKKDTASDSEEDTGSDSESDSDDAGPLKQPAVKAAETAAHAKPPANLKSEEPKKAPIDDESSSEEESEENDEESARNKPEVTKPASMPTNTINAKITKAACSSESSSGASKKKQPAKEKTKATVKAPAPSKTAAAPLANGKQPKAAAPQDKHNSSEFVDESSSENGTDSEREEADESVAMENRSGDLSFARSEVIANDFHLLKATEEIQSSEVAEFFKDAKEKGKQIWYFTAPANVPIEVVQQHVIPIDKVKQGQPVLTYGGSEYVASLDEDFATQAVQVIIPSKSGTKYTDRRTIDRALHIKQVTRFPADDQVSAAATKRASAPAPRPQPKGLKARYHPIGVSKGVIGVIGPDESSDSDSDVDMAEASTPKGAAKPAAAPQKKRKLSTNTPKAPAAKNNKKARLDGSNKKITPIVPPQVSSPPVPRTVNSLRKQTAIPVPPIPGLTKAP